MLYAGPGGGSTPRGKQRNQEAPLVHREEEFTNLHISMDGGTYVRCKFSQCNLLFSGLLPATFDDCEFKDCIWDFAGPAANTLAYMRMLHQAGGEIRGQMEEIIGKVRSEGAPG
jgi:hypothetical protein